MDAVLALLVAFAVSLVVTLGVIRLAKGQGWASLDSDFSGPQKFHSSAVPRIGGLGIGAGLVAAVPILWVVDPAAGVMAAVSCCAAYRRSRPVCSRTSPSGSGHAIGCWPRRFRPAWRSGCSTR